MHHRTPSARVVTQMFPNERTDRRTDDRTMAAGAPVTWRTVPTFLKLPGVKQGASARTRPCICADALASARTLRCVRADASQRPRGHGRPRGRISLPSPLPPSVPSPSRSPSLPSVVRADAGLRPRRREKKKKKKRIFLKIIFGFQSPKFPKSPKSPKSGLVPLVTHPSSIRLLGCLIPKFLSLSLHSL
jgi:hypothetical protein